MKLTLTLATIFNLLTWTLSPVGWLLGYASFIIAYKIHKFIDSLDNVQEHTS